MTNSSNLIALSNRIVSAKTHLEVLTSHHFTAASSAPTPTTFALARLNDADVALHFRKLALVLHPDKLYSVAAALSEDELRLVKEAYAKVVLARDYLATAHLRAAAARADDAQVVHRKTSDEDARGKRFTPAPIVPRETVDGADAKKQRLMRDRLRRESIDPLARVQQQLAEEQELFNQLNRKRPRE